MIIKTIEVLKIDVKKVFDEDDPYAALADFIKPPPPDVVGWVVREDADEIVVSGFHGTLSGGGDYFGTDELQMTIPKTSILNRLTISLP